MKNQPYGVIRGRVGRTPSVSAFRAGQILSDFLPKDGRWPKVGSLLRIPQTVILSSGNDASQNASSGGVSISTPDLKTEIAFPIAKEIIESARPGRTFVFMRGIHRGPDIPGWPHYSNDLPFAIHEDIPAANAGFLLPSLLILQFGNPNINRREFNDGTNRVLIPYAISAATYFPSASVRLWDDGRDVTISGVRQTTLSERGEDRAAQFQDAGLDYRFEGMAPAPLDGGWLAGIIADHFGFDL